MVYHWLYIYVFFSKGKPQEAGTVGKLGVSLAPLQPVLPGTCNDCFNENIGKYQLSKE